MVNCHPLPSPSPWILWLQLPGRGRRCKCWKQTAWHFSLPSEEEENIQQTRRCEDYRLVLALAACASVVTAGGQGGLALAKLPLLPSKVNWYRSNSLKMPVKMTLWVLTVFFASYDTNYLILDSQISYHWYHLNHSASSHSCTRDRLEYRHKEVFFSPGSVQFT